jgi:beta-phosphoglucomutase-like phosphatase (HAD superfamily)
MSDFPELPQLPGLPEAVVCDMDGLLLDSESHIRAAFLQELEERGYYMPEADYTYVIGRTSRDSQRHLLEYFGADFPVQDIWNAVGVGWRTRCAVEGVPTKPGVMELLALLDELGLPHGLATSTRREPALECLLPLGLDLRFSAIVTGDEVEHGKPAPDIYLKAAERLGIDPKHCLALEDSEPGAIAAASAGMRVIIVPDLRQPGEEAREAAFAVVPSLLQVAEMLRQAARRADAA